MLIARPRRAGAVSRGPVTRRKLSFSIPFEVVDEIDRYAERSGAKSRSAALTDLVERGLASARQAAAPAPRP